VRISFLLLTGWVGEALSIECMPGVIDYHLRTWTPLASSPLPLSSCKLPPSEVVDARF